MLGLLSGLGRGMLDSKYEQKLLQRKRFEEWQKEQMELSSEEKAYISNVPRYQRALELANEKGTFKKVCQAAFLVQLNFQSIWKENIKLRHS